MTKEVQFNELVVWLPSQIKVASTLLKITLTAYCLKDLNLLCFEIKGKFRSNEIYMIHFI